MKERRNYGITLFMISLYREGGVVVGQAGVRGIKKERRE
jgi:hypothetical protein